MPPLFAHVRRAVLLCLFCTAVLASGIALCPPGGAQSPPGYPGSGPSPGWHPVKPNSTPDGTLGSDPLNTPSLFNAYDWSRLDIISSSSINGQPYGPVTEKYSSGNAQGSVGGVGPHLGDFSDHSISGASTIKFKWVPPKNAAGQPDDANFPAPPLFVLGSILANGQVSGPAGMEGSGHLADGWGWSAGMTLTGSVTEPTHRKVLSASGSATLGSPVSVSLSPSGDIHIKVVGPNQVGGGEVVLTEFAYPITLSMPNPLTNPLLGDGTNQFIYSYHQPKGILVIPASAIVSGAGADDMAWIKPHLTLPLTPPVANIVANSLTISGTSVVVTTPGKYPDPDTATNYPGASYIAKGLLAANSGFGNHVVMLTVDGQASQFANCQLFYAGAASNWPTSDGIAPDVQNFYYYYHPYYPLGAFETIYDAINYKPQFLAYTNYYPDSSGKYTISIEQGTGGGALSVPVFDINPIADPMLNRKLIRQVGTLSIKGIHRYVFIAAHERGHQRIFQLGGIYTTAVPNASGGYDWPPSPDGDDVLDAWENTHHLKANAPDTTLAYSNQRFEPEPGDDEVLADVQALKPLLDNKDLWKVDWADFGVQYGGGTKLYWVAKPIASPAVFYWKFTPFVSGNPASGSGISPFQKGVGTTVGPFGDGTYPIQSLKDLTDQYPNLLTDLPAQE